MTQRSSPGWPPNGIPLTMCPLSNVKLRVFDRIEDHNLRRLLHAGVVVTVNSDDPAYFGGYILDNYLAVAEALDLSAFDVATIARNSIEASFIFQAERDALLDEIDAVAARFSSTSATATSHAGGEGTSL